MLKIEVVETVYHTSTLSDEEEKMVMDYIKNNPEKFEYESAEKKITKAIWDLYFESESFLNTLFKSFVAPHAATPAVAKSPIVFAEDFNPNIDLIIFSPSNKNNTLNININQLSLVLKA